ISIEKKHGQSSSEYKHVINELAAQFMLFKYASPQLNTMINILRNLMNTIRTHERKIMHLCIEKGKLPRSTFIKSFQGNEDNLQWIEKYISDIQHYKMFLSIYLIIRLKLQTLQKKAT